MKGYGIQRIHCFGKPRSPRTSIDPRRGATKRAIRGSLGRPSLETLETFESKGADQQPISRQNRIGTTYTHARSSSPHCTPARYR